MKESSDQFCCESHFETDLLILGSQSQFLDLKAKSCGGKQASKASFFVKPKENELISSYFNDSNISNVPGPQDLERIHWETTYSSKPWSHENSTNAHSVQQ